MSRTTLNDVASKAGVSQSTVSRVINGHTSVRPEVRDRVKRAISDLSYSKSPSSHAQQKGTDRLMGVVVADLLAPFFPTMIRGIQDVAEIHNYHTVICDSENNRQQEEMHFQNLHDLGVRGIICVPVSGANEHYEQFIREGFPLVFLDREPANVSAPTVTSTNYEGAHAAVRYLLSLGHKQLLFIAGLPDSSADRDRRDGVRQAVVESGLPTEALGFVNCGFDFETAYDTVRDLIEHDKFPYTAVFASDDMMAFGTLRALESAGVRVPEDVSVIGFDDLVISSLVSLTTVYQPAAEMGKNAALMLINSIQGNPITNSRLQLETSLKLRSTCARPGKTQKSI